MARRSVESRLSSLISTPSQVRDSVDVFSEALDAYREGRAWRERKNIQRQQIMSTMAKDTSKTYNQDDLKANKKRLQDYFNKYQSQFDDETMEYGNMLLGNMDTQRVKNDSFNQYEARQDSEMQKVVDFTNEFEIGEEYSDEDLEKFRKVVAGYTDYTEKFATDHGDRLQLVSNRHINKNLAHGSYVNDYMLDSFFDDKKIDKVEYDAYKESIARNSIQPILDYNDYHSSLIKSSSKALIEQMEGNVQEYKKFKSIMDNKIPITKEYDPSGEATGLFYDKAEQPTKDAIDSQVTSLGLEIGRDDKAHLDRHGTSYIDYQHKDLFPKPTPPPTKDIGEIGQSFTEEEDEYLQSLQKDVEPDAGDTVEIYNPGNLKFANQTEAKGKDKRGFAIFPSEEAGWDALYRQIELDKGRDLTLDKFINKYAPPSENDTTSYLKNVQRELKTGKNTNINKLDTKELAVAIAKQEGYGGNFPEIEGEPPPPKAKAKGLKIDSPLTKVKDGKTVVNYSNANSSSFKKQQTNLKKIASQKYNIKENKNKYNNVNDFVQSKFEEWLRSTGKYGKYAEEDFKYFIPTKVDRKNQVNSNPDMNRYNLYYPGAFSGAKGDVRMMIKPKVGSGYLGFAEDFDEFRKYLQEA